MSKRNFYITDQDMRLLRELLRTTSEPFGKRTGASEQERWK
jgi:hypothetical protein